MSDFNKHIPRKLAFRPETGAHTSSGPGRARKKTAGRFGAYSFFRQNQTKLLIYPGGDRFNPGEVVATALDDADDWPNWFCFLCQAIRGKIGLRGGLRKPMANKMQGGERFCDCRASSRHPCYPGLAPGTLGEILRRMIKKTRGGVESFQIFPVI